jgi:probable F420-dependent oxidoreductase
MELDATVRGFDLAHVGRWAQECEALGVGRLWSTETNHDPFFPLVLAASATERVGVATGVAIAIPRSPMHLAYAAWDLQQLSRGRFVLGVGSQIKPHIRHRFSSTWDKPVSRLRELVLAVKAIHAAWQDDSELAFRGDFYRHTLMPPAFRPERLGPWAPPPVVMAAYRRPMLEAAGEVADGVLIHPLQSVRYVRDTVLPAVEAGLAKAGRPRDAFEVTLCLFAVQTEEEIEEARNRIAFYASTPMYGDTLSAEGLEDVAKELHRLSTTGGWAEMPKLITDEILDLFVVRGASGAEVAGEIRQRYGGLVERINLHAGERSEPERWAAIAAAFRQGA